MLFKINPSEEDLYTQPMFDSSLMVEIPYFVHEEIILPSCISCQIDDPEEDDQVMVLVAYYYETATLAEALNVRFALKYLANVMNKWYTTGLFNAKQQKITSADRDLMYQALNDLSDSLADATGNWVKWSDDILNMAIKMEKFV